MVSMKAVCYCEKLMADGSSISLLYLLSYALAWPWEVASFGPDGTISPIFGEK